MSAESPRDETPAPEAKVAPAPQAGRRGAGGLLWLLAVLALVLGAGSAWLAWQGGQRIQRVEQELVRRQQDSAAQAIEARALARQAQESAADAVARIGLVEGRLSDAVLQRGQLDEVMLWMSRSRDESLLVEVEAGIRMAAQQAQAMGSAQPLLQALRLADERLARADQPRMEVIRRAIARDVAQIQSVAISDVPTLARKLDDTMRVVDDLPLRSAPTPPSTQAVPVAPSQTTGDDAATAPWWSWQRWTALSVRVRDAVATEARALVRVTRIDQPDAMLLAPAQAFFLRENLKLKLLNARLALLNRQVDLAQADLRLAEAAVEKYFVVEARRTQQVLLNLRQVVAQAHQTEVPRPDEALAALAAAAGGR